MIKSGSTKPLQNIDLDQIKLYTNGSYTYMYSKTSKTQTPTGT